MTINHFNLVDFQLGGFSTWWIFNLVDFQLGGFSTWWIFNLADFQLGGFSTWRIFNLADFQLGGFSTWWIFNLADFQLGGFSTWWIFFSTWWIFFSTWCNFGEIHPWPLAWIGFSITPTPLPRYTPLCRFVQPFAPLYCPLLLYTPLGLEKNTVLGTTNAP